MEQRQFEQLATGLRQQALQTARHVLANEDDANDAASEAMLRLWAVHDTLKDASHATRLAIVVARHTAIDQLRQSHPSVSIDQAPPNATCHLTSATAEAPDRQMEWHEDEEWLRRRISQLPPREMQVLRLRQVERKSNAEIARLLGIGEASVSTMLSAARRKLFNDIKERNRQ